MTSRLGRALSLALLAGYVSGGPAYAVDPDPMRGGTLFRRYCAGCHGPDGRGGAQTFMPHINTLTQAGYIELVPDEYLVGVINEGGPSVGKSSYMPAWRDRLTPDDVNDIVAHIRTLPRY